MEGKRRKRRRQRMWEGINSWREGEHGESGAGAAAMRVWLGQEPRSAKPDPRDVEQ